MNIKGRCFTPCVKRWKRMTTTFQATISLKCLSAASWRAWSQNRQWQSSSRWIAWLKSSDTNSCNTCRLSTINKWCLSSKWWANTPLSARNSSYHWTTTKMTMMMVLMLKHSHNFRSRWSCRVRIQMRLCNSSWLWRQELGELEVRRRRTIWTWWLPSRCISNRGNRMTWLRNRHMRCSSCVL